MNQFIILIHEVENITPLQGGLLIAIIALGVVYKALDVLSRHLGPKP